VKFRRARRAVLLLLLLAGLLGVTTVARAQFQTHGAAASAGGACTTGDFAFPDPSGYALKCIASLWTIVNQPAAAAGSTGYVQFDNSGALGASSNLFWDNTLFRLGIGSSAPVVSLDLSQRTDALALPVGTQGQEPASPMNGMIRYSTTANDIEAYIAGAWTTLTTGSSTAAITLGTSAATPDPASSFSATTGLFSGASGRVSVTSTGNEIARFTGTGVSIGTTYVSTAAPTNGLIVQGNVGIGTTSPAFRLEVPWISGDASATAHFGSSNSSDNQPAIFAESSSSSGSIQATNYGFAPAISGYSPYGNGIEGTSGWVEAAINAVNTGGGPGVAAYAVDDAAAIYATGYGAMSGLFVAAGATGDLSPTLVTRQYGSNLADLFEAQNSSNNPLVVINYSGYVGIGTTSPLVSFDLSRKTDALALPVGTQGQEPSSPMNGMIRYSTTANDVEAYISGAWTTLTTGGAAAQIMLGTSATTPDPASSYSATTGEFSPASGVYAVSSAGTEVMRVNSTGVGIGTTSPSYLLHVGSPTAVGVVADFQNSSGYCTFAPSANGILTTCTSDVRLKKDIVDAGDALAWLGTMRIRDFTLRATGERRTGVIAQEMMKVHPEMVRMGATGFYQVDVPDAWNLIKAIQELKAENDDLATRIDAEDDALKAANDNISDLRSEVAELRKELRGR
jgi:hypothetical protein